MFRDRVDSATAGSIHFESMEKVCPSIYRTIHYPFIQLSKAKGVVSSPIVSGGRISAIRRPVTHRSVVDRKEGGKRKDPNERERESEAVSASSRPR